MRRSLHLAAAALALSTLSMEALARQSRDDLNPPKPKRPTKADKKAAKRARTRGLPAVDSQTNPPADGGGE